MLAGIAKLVLGLVECADLLEHFLVRVHQGRRLDMKPAPGGVVDRRRGQGGHHELDRTHRPRHHGQLVEIVVFARPADIFPLQQCLQDIQALVELLAALLDRRAHPVHLDGKGAAPDAEDQASVGEQFGQHHLAGIGAHVMQRQLDDRGDDLDAPCRPGDLDRHLQRSRVHQDVHQMMFGDGHRRIAEALSGNGLLQHVCVMPVGAIAGVRIVG